MEGMTPIQRLRSLGFNLHDTFAPPPSLAKSPPKSSPTLVTMSGVITEKCSLHP